MIVDKYNMVHSDMDGTRHDQKIETFPVIYLFNSKNIIYTN